MTTELLQQIKIKTMCLFIRQGKILASKGYDEKKKETFYRIIGGNLEFGERADQGIKREIKEELLCAIENLELVDVIENIFIYNGKRGHEIVFLYKGTLSNENLYQQERIRIVEPYAEFDAEWVSIDDIVSGKVILYPVFQYSEIFKRH